jgi:hypothetical protein
MLLLNGLFGDTMVKKHVVETQRSHVLFCKPRETVWARNPGVITLHAMRYLKNDDSC